MYECPNCGGNLKFDIASQKLACAYCDGHFDPYSIKKDRDAIETSFREAGFEETDSTDDQFYEVTVFTCPQCGGELFSEDNEATTFCSFCGASTILSSRISKEKRPDFIIPFKKTKEDCKKAYAQKMRKAFFVPKQLRDPEYIDEFRGIYMPYWTYQLVQNGRVSLKGEKSYRKGNYVYTEHYDLSGDLDSYYLGYSYDASTSFYDNISEALAPYDAKELVNFTPAFLSGFYADTADVDSKLYLPDAMEKAEENTFRRIRKEEKFKSCTVTKPKNKKQGLGTSLRKADNTMYPVWFLTYRNKDRVAYMTVNGQTGKVVADMPIDPKRYLAASLLLAIPIFLLLNLFFTFRPVILLGLSAALSVLSAVIYGVELDAIYKREHNLDDRALKGKRGKKIKTELGGKFFLNVVVSVAAVLIAAAIGILKPVSDIYYYSGVLIGLGIVLFNMVGIIWNYNKLAMRRLPQFNKKGGDHRG